MKAAAEEAKHGFTQQFLGEHPEDDRPFRVLRDRWNVLMTNRTIEEWEYVE